MKIISQEIRLDKKKFLKAKGRTSYDKLAELTGLGRATIANAYYKDKPFSMKNALKMKNVLGDVFKIVTITKEI